MYFDGISNSEIPDSLWKAETPVARQESAAGLWLSLTGRTEQPNYDEISKTASADRGLDAFLKVANQISALDPNTKRQERLQGILAKAREGRVAQTPSPRGQAPGGSATAAKQVKAKLQDIRESTKPLHGPESKRAWESATAYSKAKAEALGTPGSSMPKKPSPAAGGRGTGLLQRGARKAQEAGTVLHSSVPTKAHPAAPQLPSVAPVRRGTPSSGTAHSVLQNPNLRRAGAAAAGAAAGYGAYRLGKHLLQKRQQQTQKAAEAPTVQMRKALFEGGKKWVPRGTMTGKEKAVAAGGVTAAGAGALLARHMSKAKKPGGEKT